jgi:hypothetical protein
MRKTSVQVRKCFVILLMQPPTPLRLILLFKIAPTVTARGASIAV